MRARRQFVAWVSSLRKVKARRCPKAWRLSVAPATGAKCLRVGRVWPKGSSTVAEECRCGTGLMAAGVSAGDGLMINWAADCHLRRIHPDRPGHHQALRPDHRVRLGRHPGRHLDHHRIRRHHAEVADAFSSIAPIDRTLESFPFWSSHPLPDPQSAFSGRRRG
jgi:hypothetical protein